ncbi:hypothetical protein CC80DRAFT_574579 [Byssothecium circinans]|uniref:Acid protease n=1 Tax=Byssothecium circinans TaxID=147558 RepID=A0A6A5ULC9_9PLEO|nr:hypothetical protein CC80DRAFT_574579 [Byssothecium circinans]
MPTQLAYLIHTLPLITSILALRGPALPSPNDYSQYTSGISIRYASGRFSSAWTPSINGSIFGRPFTFPIDTGSTGLLISASKAPEIGANQGVSGTEFLDSSNHLYIGRRAKLTITLDGERGTKAITRIPALIVDQYWFCPGYNEARDSKGCKSRLRGVKLLDPNNTCYMGVGFGRNSPGSNLPYATPEHNAFLNLRSINGKTLSSRNFRNGYTIGVDGIDIGLTGWNTQGYVWTGLDRGSTEDSRDWAMVNSSFSINGSAPYVGKALVDTGISQMYIQTSPVSPWSPTFSTVGILNPNVKPPLPPQTIQVAPKNTNITIGLPDLGDGNVAGYSFRVGDDKFPSQPLFIQPVGKHSPEPFANTGRKLLWGFNVGFDAVGGRFGLLCRKCNQKGSGYEESAE